MSPFMITLEDAAVDYATALQDWATSSDPCTEATLSVARDRLIMAALQLAADAVEKAAAELSLPAVSPVS